MPNDQIIRNKYAVESTSAFTAFTPEAEALCQELAKIVKGRIDRTMKPVFHSYRHGGDVLTVSWGEDHAFSIAWTPCYHTELSPDKFTHTLHAVEVCAFDTTDAIMLSQRVIDILALEGYAEPGSARIGDLEAHIKTAETQMEQSRVMIADPNIVHINMLRGTIAKPSIEQILHLYPELRTRRDQTSEGGR